MSVRIISQIITDQRAPSQFFTDYYYSRDSYYCDGTIPPGGPCGAANIIEESTNSVLLPYPPPRYRIYFTGSVTILADYSDYPASSINNFEDYYIYYGNSANPGWINGIAGTTCVEGEGDPASEMGFYEEGLAFHVVPAMLTDPSLAGKSFQLCYVGSSNQTGPPVIVQHTPYITFGFKHISIIGIEPDPLPASID